MKEILVKEVYELHGAASLAIMEDSPLEVVITKFAEDPRLRAIFLVGIDGRFLGEVIQIDLMKWLQLRLYGASGVLRRYEGSAVGRGIAIGEISRLVSATKAREVAHRNCRYLGVTENDTLQNALDKMIKYRTGILPVLDSQGRILGDLRLSEVLLKSVDIGR